jgi:hypothetical protein
MMMARQLPTKGHGSGWSPILDARERRMDFDQRVIRFFGTHDIGSLSPDQFVAGLERLRL